MQALAINLDGRGPRREITARCEREIRQPFQLLQFANFFSAETVWRLTKEFRHLLSAGVTEDTPVAGLFHRSEAQVGELRYGAYTRQLGDLAAGPFSIFYTKFVYDFIRSHFSFATDGGIQGAIHHHRPGSPSGWVHNDFHNCNFVAKLNHEGLNPWTPGTTYQYGYDQRPEIIKCYRSIAILYYFGNEPWQEGDGGETCFFRSRSWDDMFLKIPPINNTLVAFEVTPNSWHAFASNARNERNSVAMWYHSSHDVSLQRFGVLPHVTPGPKAPARS